MNTEFARQQMIKQQVRAWDVFDEDVLHVFETVKREAFVPDEYAALAFADIEIPLDYGETMMTPTIEGRLLQSLALTGVEDILEIGTGSGFLTACLAMLGKHVTSIEIHESLQQSAAARLDERGYDNIDVIRMDGMRELPDGHFDAIAVTGSMYALDERLVEALAPGGRLFVVVGEAPAMSAEVIVKSYDDAWHRESEFETVLAPLVGGGRATPFLF